MAIEILMLVLGVAAHFIKALAQIKQSGALITPTDYWRNNPYNSLMTVIGAVVAFVVLLEMHELSPINAFGAGFMANSVADVIGSRALNKMR